MKKQQWKQKANSFAQGAAALLLAGHHDTAYHVAGIAVECGLKAKIASRFLASDIPERTLVDDLYRNGHDLLALVRIAQLQPLLEQQERANPAFAAFWATVRTWRVDSRYRNWSAIEATEMVTAVTQNRTGILPWIRRHW